MRNLGWPPLLHTNSIPCSQQGHDRLSERVHVYVDVSGSIGGLKGALYGSVIDCGDMVHSRVHLFSTEVHDVTLKQLRQGVCHTTGGTDINCVAGHMRRHSVRRAVLVTDGYVWQATQPNRNTLSDVRLGVALCTAESTRGYLGEFTAFWTELDL